MNEAYSVGFLGAGQMATALAIGWKQAGLLDPVRSLGSAASSVSQQVFTERTGLNAVGENARVVEQADLLILGVKPQNLLALLDEIQPFVRADQLVISIAAGVTLPQLASRLGTSTRLVRVMPNTPCLVGASASGYTAGLAATAADIELVHRLFNAVGVAVPVPERQLDAVTGLSGSGPAFVALMIESLADGGVKMGLPRATALLLATQTVLGTAKLLQQTGQHPAQLKDSVASPAGTTIAGLHELERAGLRAGMISAVQAATKRAEELGK